MTNASILERNIVHGFDALPLPFVAEDAFWRFRDAHGPLCSERMAYRTAGHDALIGMAIRVSLPMLPETIRQELGQKWRVRVELSDFMRERLHHHDGSCSCHARLIQTRAAGVKE